MRTLQITTCPRCGNSTSAFGLSPKAMQFVTLSHVCPDGVRTPSGEPTERVVYGPGERTKLPEERL